MKLPKHIAIIPDGNRRWAKRNGLNPWEGHTEGVKRFWDTAQLAHDLGVSNLTIWAASYDNLSKRSKLEVNFLVNILKSELANGNIINLAEKNQTRIKVVGEWKEIVKSKKLHRDVEDLQNKTKHFSKTTLTLLFGYDGQREMISAIDNLIQAGSKISQGNLRKELWTGDLPDVDLVIRTGGEPHWSAGFMMWLTANSQFHFTDVLWPDFKKQEFKEATGEFDRRERRLGK